MSTGAVSRALYRSMWRWVRSPAVRHNRHFSLPLDELPAAVGAAAARLPAPVTGAQGCEQLLRLAWRDTTAAHGADAAAQLDDAFRVLRSLSELGEGLEEQLRRRLANSDRTGIGLVVGEVVRHKVYGYRGVVIGWDRRAEIDVGGWDGLRTSSLVGAQPFYHLLPDQNDCTELFGSARDIKYVAEENLERTLPRHARVWHHALISASTFTRFDPATSRFVPAPETAYLYPGSLPSREPAPLLPEPARGAATLVLGAVTRAATQLHSFLQAVEAAPSEGAPGPAVEAASAPASGAAAPAAAPGPDAEEGAHEALAAEAEAEAAAGRDTDALAAELLRTGLPKRAVGVAPAYSFPGGEEPEGAGGEARQMLAHVIQLASDAASALPAGGGGGVGGAAHSAESTAAAARGGGGLRAAFDALGRYSAIASYVSYNVAERASKSDREGIAYSVGQVLRHRKFGFRAVVFGWERRPSMDVSQWDGIQGLPSGAQQPFYRMVPDMADCLSLLGGPRGIRYVAQENLEPLPAADCAISHTLLPQVFDGFEAASGTFFPVQQRRYIYSADPLSPSPPGLAVAVDRVTHSMSRLEALLHSHNLDARRDGLLDSLLQLLAAAPSADDSSLAERAALTLLTAHPDAEVMNLMRSSERSLNEGDLLAARGALDEAMDLDDTHAELYVRRAAVALKAGEHEAALADAREALQRDVRHFGARVIEGTALRELRRYDQAIAANEAVLAVHPWAPGVVVNIWKGERAKRILANQP